MKKLFSVFVMLCCISLVLSGCGGSEGSGADFASTEVHSGVEDAESASEKNEDIVESQEDETGVSAEVVDTSLGTNMKLLNLS